MLLELVVVTFSQRVQKRTKCARKGQVKIGARALIEPDVGKRVLIEPPAGRVQAKRVHRKPSVKQKNVLWTRCGEETNRSAK